MKKHFYLSLAVAFGLLTIVTSCNKNKVVEPVPYIVEGVVDSSYNGKMVYLRDLNTNRLIDSVLVDSNKFVFKGIADTIRFCNLNIDRKNMSLVLDTGRIIVDFEKRRSTGSPLNEAYNNFADGNKALMEESWETYKSLNEQIKDEALRAKAMDSAYNVWLPKYNTFLDKTFEANVNNVLGAVLLEELSRGYRTGQIDTAVAKLDKNIASLGMAQRVIENNEKLKNTAVGKKFSDFTIDQPDGTKKSLSDYAGKGKYVLVDFWASWCGPCRAETPNLKEEYKKYKGDNFEIVSVAVWDKPEDTQKAIEEDKLPWPQIINGQEIPTTMYGIRGIPHIMLIGPDGTILERGLRGDALKAKLAELLGK